MDHARNVAFWARVRDAQGSANATVKPEDGAEPDALEEGDDVLHRRGRRVAPSAQEVAKEERSQSG